VIRLARPDEVDAIREVEHRAGERYRTVGLGLVADSDGSPPEVVAEFIEGGRAWVFDEGAGPIGFVLASAIDGCAHIEQVSALPRGRGIGAALIRQVEAWAISEGLPALTLSTFRDVPWNAPYYECLGFSEFQPGPQLAALDVADHRKYDPQWAPAAPPARVLMRKMV
jgi:GNAT superfamily N-acetyltransferase